MQTYALRNTQETGVYNLAENFGDLLQKSSFKRQRINTLHLKK